MLDKIKTSLLAGMLAYLPPAYAEVYIINTRTLDAVQQQGEAQVPQFSLSNINIDKIRLLQSYQYADRAAAADLRRQNLVLMDTRLSLWEKNGLPGSEEIGGMRNELSKMNADIRQNLNLLSGVDLPELKQLYEAEEKNAQTVQSLIGRLEKMGSGPAAAGEENRAGRVLPVGQNAGEGRQRPGS